MKFLDTPTISSILPVFEYYVRDQFKCFGLGRVQSVDTEKGTCNVKLIMRPTMTKVGEKAVNYFDDDKKHTSPVLKDVPILMSHVTRPLYPDDNVLLAFNDYNFDDWYNNDGYIEDAGEIKHDINNAIAIAGIDNLKNSTFIAPEDYKPTQLPASLMDAPFPRYGYDNENACLHWGNGEVRAGAWGVTITSRENSNVNIYSENGSVNVFPTVGFHVNTGVCHFQVNSFPTAGALEGIDYEALEKKEHRITMYTTVCSKKITADSEEEEEELESQGLEEGDKVYTSDIYRILRYIRAILKKVANGFGVIEGDSASGLAGSLNLEKERDAIVSALTTGGSLMDMIDELGIRIDGLFAPAEPVKEE